MDITHFSLKNIIVGNEYRKCEDFVGQGKVRVKSLYGLGEVGGK